MLAPLSVNDCLAFKLPLPQLEPHRSLHLFHQRRQSAEGKPWQEHPMQSLLHDSPFLDREQPVMLSVLCHIHDTVN